MKYICIFFILVLTFQIDEFTGQAQQNENYKLKNHQDWMNYETVQIKTEQILKNVKDYKTLNAQLDNLNYKSAKIGVPGQNNEKDDSYFNPFQGNMILDECQQIKAESICQDQCYWKNNQCLTKKEDVK